MSQAADEHELWRGAPIFDNKRILTTFILIMLAFLGIGYLILQGVQTPELLAVPTILLIINAFMAYDMRSTRFYITSRKTGREHIYFPRRKKEIPLELVKAVQTKCRGSRGFVSIMPVTGSPLRFHNLVEDPELVKQVVIAAKSRLKHASESATAC